MPELIRRLRQEGNLIFLITSDLQDSVFNELRKYGLENVFSNIIVKVHDKTESVQSLINKNKFDLKETCIVGDSESEIKTARELGIKSIAVTWGFYPENKLKLANPDFIVHNVKELEQILNNNEPKS